MNKCTIFELPNFLKALLFWPLYVSVEYSIWLRNNNSLCVLIPYLVGELSAIKNVPLVLYRISTKHNMSSLAMSHLQFPFSKIIRVH